jgi:hypothetical protein
VRHGLKQWTEVHAVDAQRLQVRVVAAQLRQAWHGRRALVVGVWRAKKSQRENLIHNGVHGPPGHAGRDTPLRRLHRPPIPQRSVREDSARMEKRGGEDKSSATSHSLFRHPCTPTLNLSPLPSAALSRHHRSHARPLGQRAAAAARRRHGGSVMRRLTNAILCGAFRSYASPDAATAAAAAAQYGERLRQLSDPSSSPATIPHPHMAARRDKSTEEVRLQCVTYGLDWNRFSLDRVKPSPPSCLPPSSCRRDDDDRPWTRAKQVRYAVPADSGLL